MRASVCLSPASGGFGAMLTSLWSAVLPGLPLRGRIFGGFLSGSLARSGAWLSVLALASRVSCDALSARVLKNSAGVYSGTISSFSHLCGGALSL